MKSSPSLGRGDVVKTLARAAAGSAGLRVIGMGFGFLAGIQLARQLGVVGYGVYGVAMSVVALLSVVAEFGLPQLITREVSVAHVHRDYARVRHLLRWATKGVSLIFLTSSLLVLTFVIIFQGEFDFQRIVTLLCGLPLIWVVSVCRVKGAALRGLQKIVSGQIPETLIRPATFSLALFVWSLFSGLEPYQAVVLGVFSALASLSWASVSLLKAVPDVDSHGAQEINSFELWKNAFPMAMTEGMRMLQAHLSTLALGLIALDASVGLYRAATSLGMIMAFPLTLFAIIGSPMIARLNAKNEREELQKLLSWMSLGMTIFCGVLAIPFIFWGRDLIGLILGVEFSGANAPLLIICLGSVLTGVLGQNAVLLNMTGHQVRVMRASVIALIVIAIASPVLIFAFQEIGAAMTTTIGLFVWNSILWRDGIKYLNYDASIFSFFRRPHFPV